MIGALGRVNVYAYCEAVDMRKGFEGLAALVREQMGRDPLSGALFLFANRRCNRAKTLHFDGTGMCMLAKRLEKGRFVALWNLASRPTIPLTRPELELFLQGSHLIGRFRVAPAELTDKDLAVRS
ncbi:MAG: IS66 family insertion sequence element accessory protein TnpB [Myxococcota bacterium]